ncbi:potassium channel family protein [Paenibacillus sp. L3-i20]|uniref:potassium channel protein n=1 Tax=Paenibacillus sp. L3-i20 TaxID=2905833 RepID=UPI001EE124EC|nr:potassium channel family protein [Paenibacillus sp. L3-i20]GKU76281.1 potassium channel protein [Paenibacillus sp. L3-i20]
MHFIRLLSTKLLQLSKVTITISIILFVMISATIAYVLEPTTFNTWFNAFYWVLTTMATVGYGDYFAKTVEGKVLTIFLYIFGIGMLSLVIGKIIDSIAIFQRRRGEGTLSFQGENHIIIINWSKKAQIAVEEILSHKSKTSIVIIDESGRHPMEHQKEVHFISGDPSEDEVLSKAMIEKARAAIIFGDVRIDEASLVDGKSLLITSSIERIAPHVHTTVEIIQEKHIRNFHHVKVNEFVLSHDAISRLAVRSVMQEGNSEVFRQLLSRDYGDDIYEVAINRAWRTYGDAFKGLLDQGATLLSDRGDLGINRKLDTPIPADARLYIISDEETYLRIKGK